MATVPEIHVVQVPVRDADELAEAMSTVRAWAPVEVPRGQRPTPIVLAVLGTLAGIGAMVLGAFAVFSAGGSPGEEGSAGARATAPSVEARVLSLLAKPSTERVVFRGSGGQMVLAVGTGGRAAILLRGLEPAPAGKPYHAWIVAPAGAPVRAGRFLGTEPAVFLSRSLGPKASVVVSAERPVLGRSGRPLLIATRG